MANSRSNIYPVKLQGAELNLNKFDAEIKQYSGFNKNNSPFVGGCLSNLFTKTEENTTGSSDSVYVDDNGDVYEAKTDGLYKNGEKVLKFTTYLGNGIVDHEQLDLPDNTIYVQPVRYWVIVEEKIDYKFLYITYEGTFLDETLLKIHYDGVVQNCYCELSDVSAAITEFDFSFNSNRLLVRFSTVYNNKVYIEAKAFQYDPNNHTFTSYNSFNPKISINVEDYIKIPAISLDEYGSIYGLDETYKYSNGQKVPLEESGSASRTTCIGKSKYFYPGNGSTAYLLDVTNYTTSGSQGIMLCVRINTSGGSITFLKDDSSSKVSDSYPSDTTLSVKLGKANSNYDLKGLCYALKFSDDKLFYGIAGPDCITDQVTLVEDDSGTKHAMMYMGVKSGNRLYNNGVLTGLSIENVLVTDWNSVTSDSVSTVLQENIITYKKNNKWLCVRFSQSDYPQLHEFKLKLSKINNLLVVNRTGLNCYRLSDNKALYFAPDWNNRIFYTSATIIKSGTAITDNAGYMATSINEYNLKDNASILLNPVPVIKLPSISIESYEGRINYLDQEIINLYMGLDSDILYECSFFVDSMYGRRNYSLVKSIFCNKDLINLPFPINTSGNVQLSPSLFCKTERFGNDVFIKEGSNAYQLIKEGSESVMSYYLGTRIDNLEDIFILQGQYYAIIDKQIFNVQFSGGVVQSLSFVVSVENLQFCGNSAYQAYFFSKTNRCIYVFTGANILNQLHLVDKISEIYAYKYNQSTQSIILITDIGTIVSSNLGMYLIEGFTPDDVFFYDKGVVFVSDSELTYLQYYEADGFEKHNIEVETCFYGMNNETVTINDCLYFRLFSEEHEEGEVKVSATTISLKGRKTETTVFKFKASDWDALTHSVYVRYQPKEQRGLGISFSINSPFKIASLSVGSKADAILVDKVSKGAVITPSNNDEW